jgi:hypothetical protein
MRVASRSKAMLSAKDRGVPWRKIQYPVRSGMRVWRLSKLSKCFILLLGLSQVAAWSSLPVARVPRSSVSALTSFRTVSAKPVPRLHSTLTAAMLSVETKTASAFPSQRIKLNGVEHHVRDTGDPSPSAPIALLMHGFAGSTDSWEDVAPLLYEGGVRAVAVDRVGFGRTERPMPPTLPPPPPLPGREILAASLESLIDSDSSPYGLLSLLPDPRAALATALRRPTTLAPRLPWELSRLGRDPYSSKFAVSVLSPLIKSLVRQGDERRVYFVGHSAGGERLCTSDSASVRSCMCMRVCMTLLCFLHL